MLNQLITDLSGTFCKWKDTPGDCRAFLVFHINPPELKDNETQGGSENTMKQIN